MRDKTGDLEAIRAAKARGLKVEQAKTTNHANKEIQLGTDFIKIIYSVI